MKNSPIKTVSEQLREKFGDRVDDHVPLSRILPSGLGGVADWCLTAYEVTDIVEAAKIAIENKLPYRLVGLGSGILAGESGFPGLIIRNATSAIMPSPDSSRVVCESGVSTSVFISKAASKSLGGAEFLVQIPGTVGGAVATCAGASGQLVSSYVREVSLFDPDSQRVISVPGSSLSTAPYQPLFANELVHPPLILTITFQMARLSQDEILRRLSVIGRNQPKLPPRSFGRIFTESLRTVPVEGALAKQLRRLGVRYRSKEDCLLLEDKTQPSQVRQAIEQLIENAANYGIEAKERLTYLGYYQGEDDER